MLIVAFAGALLLLSFTAKFRHRTFVSTALFLGAGFLLGKESFGVLTFGPDSELVAFTAELALFIVLITDGMKMRWSDIQVGWQLPARALAIGLPATLLITALTARFLFGLDWAHALLIGAILAPTDPVFCASIVGNARVPKKIRDTLNVESGINDGLALPFVVFFIALAAQTGEAHIGALSIELLLGIAIGLAVPWGALKLAKFLPSTPQHKMFAILAIVMLVYGVAQMTHANLFIAAFIGGIVVATIGHDYVHAFEEMGEMAAEMGKFGALLVFGSLISLSFLSNVPWQGWVFAAFAIAIARPVAIWLSLTPTPLAVREKATVMWFGPKGFASVVYGLMALESGIPQAELVFHLTAVTIVLSLLLHSWSDLPVAHMFTKPDTTPTWRALSKEALMPTKKRKVKVPA